MTDVLVLCGGKGTRLKGVTGEAPKALAPVAGRPFLDFLLEYLKGQGLADHLEKVEAGHKIRVGEIEITFLHTPGHTPGSQCFLVDNRLVSGDTLFIGACGRCDLPGGNAAQMYESLQQLAKLDESTLLMPGHNYADTPTSTIGDEKKTNPYYQIRSLSDFLGLRMGY